MKDRIIQELKKCSCIKGKQRTWISELSDEQLYQIYLKIRTGEKAQSIARFCQEIWGINPDSTAHSISLGILKFKKRIDHLLIVVQSYPAEQINLPPITSSANIHSLEANQIIASKLRERINRLLREEEEFGVKHSYLSRDIQALSTLEKTIVKQKDWMKKNPGEDPILAMQRERQENRMQLAFKKYMHHSTEEGRQNFLLAMTKFMEEMKGNEYTLEINDNGEYRLYPPGVKL